MATGNHTSSSRRRSSASAWRLVVVAAVAASAWVGLPGCKGQDGSQGAASGTPAAAAAAEPAGAEPVWAGRLEQARALEKAGKTAEAVEAYGDAIRSAEPPDSGASDQALAELFERRAICHLRLSAKLPAALDYHRACCLDRRLETPVKASMPPAQFGMDVGQDGTPSAFHIFSDRLVAYSWDGVRMDNFGTGKRFRLYRHDPNPPWPLLETADRDRIPITCLSVPPYVRGQALALPAHATVPNGPVDLPYENGRVLRVDFTGGFTVNVCLLEERTEQLIRGDLERCWRRPAKAKPEPGR